MDAGWFILRNLTFLKAHFRPTNGQTPQHRPPVSLPALSPVDVRQCDWFVAQLVSLSSSAKPNMYLCVLWYFWFPCISPRCNETLVFLTQDNLLNEICNPYPQRYCYLALSDPLLCNKYTVDEMFACFNLFPMRPVPVLSNVHHIRTSLSTTSIDSDLKLDLWDLFSSLNTLL